MDRHQSTQVERPYCAVTLKNDNAPELCWNFYPRHSPVRFEKIHANTKSDLFCLKYFLFDFSIPLPYILIISYYYISCYLQLPAIFISTVSVAIQWCTTFRRWNSMIFFLGVIGRLAPSVTSFQSRLSCRSCFVWQLANKNINTDSYLTGRWQWCYTDIDWICSIWFTYMIVHYVNVYMISYKCKWI